VIRRGARVLRPRAVTSAAAARVIQREHECSTTIVRRATITRAGNSDAAIMSVAVRSAG
jgi:hypothetical protein